MWRDGIAAMEIIHYKKPRLPDIKMVCDEVIDKKLTRYPAIEACFARNNTTLVSGGTGSGKSTWVLQMAKSVWFQCYEQVILIMPENSYNSISPEHNVFAKYLEPENVIHELTPEILEEVYDKIEEAASAGENTLLIIDDWGHLLKDKAIEKILKKIFLKNRHLHCTSVVLVQNYYMLGKGLREIINNVVMFNTNKSQNEKMFKEQFDMKEDQFRQLISLLPTTHDYILVNLKYKRIFHNYDEVVFHALK